MQWMVNAVEISLIFGRDKVVVAQLDAINVIDLNTNQVVRGIPSETKRPIVILFYKNYLFAQGVDKLHLYTVHLLNCTRFVKEFQQRVSLAVEIL